MKIDTAGFSKTAKKASRLLMKLRRGFDLTPSLSISSILDRNSGGGILGGIVSFLFARKVGRQRV